MRGDLSEIPAADICRALAVDGSSGVLDIEGPDGRGTVVFDGGAVIAAGSPTPRARLGDRLVSAGLLEEEALASVLRTHAHRGGQRLGSLLVAEGLVTHDAVRVVAQEQVIDAVFDVVGWSYGAFRFESHADDAPTSEIPVRFAVDDLLVEVARRHEEWSNVRQVIPDLHAVPSFRPDARAAPASLEPDEFTLLASIDGARSVRELADDLGYGHFEAARIVYGLTLIGVVEVALPEDEVGRALEDALRDLHPEPEVGPPPAPEPVVRDPGELDVAALLAELEAEPIRSQVEPSRLEAPSPQLDDTSDGEVAAVPARDATRDDGQVRDEQVRDEQVQGEQVRDEAPTRVDGREVAELLRELSRMSLEDPEGPDGQAPPPEPPKPPASPPPHRPEPGRDDPPRRRRLFGRG